MNINTIKENSLLSETYFIAIQKKSIKMRKRKKSRELLREKSTVYCEITILQYSPLKSRWQIFTPKTFQCFPFQNYSNTGFFHIFFPMSIKAPTFYNVSNQFKKNIWISYVVYYIGPTTSDLNLLYFLFTTFLTILVWQIAGCVD